MNTHTNEILYSEDYHHIIGKRKFTITELYNRTRFCPICVESINWNGSIYKTIYLFGIIPIYRNYYLLDKD